MPECEIKCARNGGKFECGERIEHAMPIVDPANICEQALRGRLTVAQRRRAETEPQALIDLRSADAHLDLGLLPSITDDEAKEHFKSAGMLLNGLIASKLSRPSVLQAQLLNAYLKPLELLRGDKKLPFALEQHTMKGVQKLFINNKNVPIHSGRRSEHQEAEDYTPCYLDEGEKRGVDVRLAFFQLCFGMGTLPYPTLQREVDTLKYYNHKAHAFVLAGSSRVYFRIGCNLDREQAPENPKKPVQFSLKSAVGKAALHAGYTTINDKPGLAIELLRDEAAGVRHRGKEARLLVGMRRDLGRSIAEFSNIRPTSDTRNSITVAGQS